MAFTNSTTHYGLPQWIGTDKPTYLVDQNNAYATIDTQLYTASTDAASAVATANSASASATTAAENAATALTTANTADGKADSAITQAGLAQTAAGAAQVAAAAAQEAAAGNSIANLAPPYDSTLTYNVGDLVTAQGKLYKCIVTVSTPMDFDINYWDDVTTSEVYARSSDIHYYAKISEDLSYSVPADTSKTHSQFIDYSLNTIFTIIKNSLAANQRAIIKRIVYNSSSYVLESNTVITADSTALTNIQTSTISNDGTAMRIVLMVKWDNNNPELVETAINHSDSVVTYANNSNLTAANSPFAIIYDIEQYM